MTDNGCRCLHVNGRRSIIMSAAFQRFSVPAVQAQRQACPVVSHWTGACNFSENRVAAKENALVVSGPARPREVVCGASSRDQPPGANRPAEPHSTPLAFAMTSSPCPKHELYHL